MPDYKIHITSWKMDGSGNILKTGFQKLPNGDYYEGEFVNGRRHGTGKLRFWNGNEYRGGFREGEFHGYGFYQYASFCMGGERLVGRLYEGEWRAGKRHGKGRFVVGNGEHYEGGFMNDKFHGQGTYVYKNGDRYMGEWVQGKWHGKGKVMKATGESYNGTFHNGKYHGAGTYRYPHASGSYVGNYENGMAHGKGRRVYSDGTVYEGQFRFGKMGGDGVLTKPNGDIYVGGFLDNKFHGRGNMRWSNGESYEGDWLRGKPCGRGRYTYLDGSYYEGEYMARVYTGIRGRIVVGLEHDCIKALGKYGQDITMDRLSKLTSPKTLLADGKRHGKGIRVWATGARYEGDWANDEMHGYGIYVKEGPHPERYEGEFRYGLRHGKGFCAYAGGDRNAEHEEYRMPCTYEGEWFKGKKHGFGVLRFADGRVYEGQWEHDRRHGDGALDLIAEASRGIAEDWGRGGMGTMYRPERYVGQFNKNKRTGKGALYMSSGDVWSGQFVKGHLEGIAELQFYRTGKKRLARMERGYRKEWLSKEEEHTLRTFGFRRDSLALKNKNKEQSKKKHYRRSVSPINKPLMKGSSSHSAEGASPGVPQSRSRVFAVLDESFLSDPSFNVSLGLESAQ